MLKAHSDFVNLITGNSLTSALLDPNNLSRAHGTGQNFHQYMSKGAHVPGLTQA